MSFWYAVDPPQPKWVILLEWIVICLSITTGCILVAATIYTSRYQQFRFIEARRWNLLLTSSCFAIVEALLREPFYILLRMGFFGHSSLPDYANTVLYTTFVHGYTILTVTRLWLAMYDIRHTEAVKKKAWRLKINPDDQDFFLSHRRTLGNYPWLWKRLAAGECIVAASMLLVMRRRGLKGAWNLINMLWVVSLSTFMVVTYWKLRQIKFKDIFFFHEELRLEVIILLTSFVGYVAVFGVLADSRTRRHTPFVSFLMLYYEVGTAFVATFVQTRWNVNRLEQQRIAKQKEAQIDDEELPQRPSFRVDVHTYYLVTVEQCRKEFARVVADQQGFDEFIEHLVSEFSLESLLFIVEVMQYKNSLVKRSSVSTNPRSMTVFTVDLSFMPLSLTRDITGESEDGAEEGSGFWLTLPPELPHSPLAEIADEFDRGSYLYEKYVSTKSEMEINISYACRLELQRYFEREDEDVMLSSVSSGSSRCSTKSKELVFDDAAQEVLTLMLDSFQRFKLGRDG